LAHDIEDFSPFWCAILLLFAAHSSTPPPPHEEVLPCCHDAPRRGTPSPPFPVLLQFPLLSYAIAECCSVVTSHTETILRGVCRSCLWLDFCKWRRDMRFLSPPLQTHTWFPNIYYENLMLTLFSVFFFCLTPLVPPTRAADLSHPSFSPDHVLFLGTFPTARLSNCALRDAVSFPSSIEIFFFVCYLIMARRFFFLLARGFYPPVSSNPLPL